LQKNRTDMPTILLAFGLTLCETFQEEFIEKWHEHMDDNND